MLKKTFAAIVVGVSAVLLDASAQRRTIVKLPPVQTAPAATKKFVNTQNGLNANLKERFVEFSFNYPAGWKLPPRSPQNQFHFAELYRGQPPAPQEFISVGYFRHICRFSNEKLLNPITEGLINDITGKFMQQILDDAEMLPPEQIKVGGYDAVSVRFEGTESSTGKKRRIWGRTIQIPGVKKIGQYYHGVLFVVLASEASPDIKNSAEVGFKGDAPTILNSFKFLPQTAENSKNTADSPVLVKTAMGTELSQTALGLDIANVKYSFKKGELIFAQFNAANVVDGMKVKTVWRMLPNGDNPGKIIQEDDYTEEGEAGCAFPVMYRRRQEYTNELMPGKYQFEIYFDGQLVKTMPFTLEP